MRGLIPFVIACLIAVAVPFAGGYITLGEQQQQFDFPGWPQTYEGLSLEQLELTDAEKKFEKEFPGKMAKFTDGHREILFRWVTRETRKLHPAADCFRGTGYNIHPLPMEYDRNGNAWGAMEATKNGKTFKIKERIHDNAKNTYPDISTWYWAALKNKTTAPWWAVTVSNRINKNSQGH